MRLAAYFRGRCQGRPGQPIPPVPLRRRKANRPAARANPASDG
jgi:hypothetical protein